MVTPPSKQSFEAAVLPHLDAAFNLARCLMRNAHDAEDVVQESMMRALTYYRSFRGDNARAWLLQIVRNTAYAVFNVKHGTSNPANDDENTLADLPDLSDGPDILLMRKEHRAQIARLLQGLPIELREVLVLREFEELSYKEIARITETPIGTVMSRLSRARHLLADGLSRESISHG